MIPPTMAPTLDFPPVLASAPPDLVAPSDVAEGVGVWLTNAVDVPTLTEVWGFVMAGLMTMGWVRSATDAQPHTLTVLLGTV